MRKLLDKCLEMVNIVLLSAMTLLVTWQVITRYLFNSPSTYSEILAKYMFIWLVFLGAAYVFGKKEHMNIAFIKEKFGEVSQLKLNILIEAIIMLFSISVLLIGGTDMMTHGFAQAGATLGVTMGSIYSVIPLSGLIIVTYNVLNILDDLKVLRGNHHE